VPPGDSGEHSPGPSPRPGRNIVVGGRDQQAAAQVEEEIRGLGVAVRTVLADVTRRADIERTLEETVSAFGRADVLVNNAGACIHKPAAEVTDDEWHAVMNVNLGGVWIASQVFGRHMIKSGGGSIINIGSMSGSIVNRPQWQPAYNASRLRCTT